MTNPHPRTPADIERISPIALKLYPRIIEMLELSEAESAAILTMTANRMPKELSEDQISRISFLIGIEQRLEGLTFNGQINLSPAEWMHAPSEQLSGQTPVEYLATAGLAGMKHVRDILDALMI